MSESFPGNHLITNPIIDLRHEIEIQGDPVDVWPWIQQVGYHRAGWYIDTWWDRFTQQYFWPLVVPREARGSYEPPANRILPEYQDIAQGDIIPDGPEGSARYEVVGIEKNHLLMLYATSHFNYMAPRFVYKTKWAPKGAFCWAFVLSPVAPGRSRLLSWWQAQATPKAVFTVLRPLFALVDTAHQKEILRGIKRRVERRLQSPTP